MDIGRPVNDRCPRQEFAVYSGVSLSTVSLFSTVGVNLIRREFITLLGGAAFAVGAFVSPEISFAQQELKKAPRIGFLTRATDASVSTQIDAFRQSLRDLGWVEGKASTSSTETRRVEPIVSRRSPLNSSPSRWMSSSR
jgi:hypothetical protein